MGAAPTPDECRRLELRPEGEGDLGRRFGGGGRGWADRAGSSWRPPQGAAEGGGGRVQGASGRQTAIAAGDMRRGTGDGDGAGEPAAGDEHDGSRRAGARAEKDPCFN